MIKWKQTGKNTALSNMGHKLLMTDIHNPEPIYNVFSPEPEGKLLVSSRDKAKIDHMINPQLGEKG